MKHLLSVIFFFLAIFFKSSAQNSERSILDSTLLSLTKVEHDYNKDLRKILSQNNYISYSRFYNYEKNWDGIFNIGYVYYDGEYYASACVSLPLDNYIQTTIYTGGIPARFDSDSVEEIIPVKTVSLNSGMLIRGKYKRNY